MDGYIVRMLVALLVLTNFWRRRVGGFEVLGRDQWRRLRDTGIPENRIALVRDGSPVTFTKGQAGAPLPAELAGVCVLLYSGNYGVAHEVETVADGYRLHHREGTGRVRLWLSAAGLGTEDLARRFTAQNLPFHRSAPVPLERLSSLPLSADAPLVTLKASFFCFVMPAKV